MIQLLSIAAAAMIVTGQTYAEQKVTRAPASDKQQEIKILEARLELNDSQELRDRLKKLESEETIKTQAPTIEFANESSSVFKEEIKVKPKKKNSKPKAKEASAVATTSNVDLDRSKSTSEQYRELLTKLEAEQAALIKARENGESIANVRSRIEHLQLEKTKLERVRETEMSAPKTESPSPVSTAAVIKGTQFSYRGHFQYRMEGARNIKGVDGLHQREQSFYRFRPYLTFTPNPKLELNFTPQATKGFGVNNASGATSGTNVHTEVFFFEANFLYRLTDTLSMKLGRQEIAYGDHMVIGTAPWDNSGRSFDAVKFTFKHNKGWSELFHSKIDNNASVTDSTDDINLTVLYNSWSLSDELKAVDLYVLNQEDYKDNGVEVNMLGMRIKGEAAGIFYRTENGIQKGRNLVGDAFQANAEVGTILLGTKVSLEYALAGDGYRQLYPTAHRFLGFADIVGRRNIEHYALHLSKPVTSWFTLNLDQHFFRRHNANRSAYKLNGSNPWGTQGSAKDIGHEIDLVANIKTADQVSLQVGAALFNPGEYLEDQAENDGKQTRFLYAQFLAEF